MASITDLSIRRPVATAMFYLVILTIGFTGARHLPVDLLPEIELPNIFLITTYPNVGPDEMELLVTQPVENAVAGVPNLTRVHSRSGEGWSWVSLDFSRGTDLAEAANDVRDALDRLRERMPPEVVGPRIRKFDPNQMPVIRVAVGSAVHDMETLTRIVDRDLIRRFEQIEGVGTIDTQGGLYREIRVDLIRDRLHAAGITAAEVQRAIARESTVAPGGNVKDGTRDLYVRALAEFQDVSEIERVVVVRRNGVPVRVGDLAVVTREFKDPGRLTELNGTPVISLRARKQSGANTVAVAEAVRNEVDRITLERGDLILTITDDTSEFIRQSIDNVKFSAIWGSLLAVFVLYLFLRNGTSTFIIALSIPISLVATFGLLFFRDLSLNQMTFGGLALGIGLIVDNAIVVLENIVRQREEGKKALKAAASVGTRQVTGAIVASTLTTSVIFLPVVFMQTITAVMFMELALVVVFALLCSLLVALTLVPMLASRFLNAATVAPDPETRTGRFRRRFDRLERAYSQTIERAVHLRWLVFGGTSILVVAAVLVARQVPVELTPDTDANEIRVNLTMDEGTNLAIVLAYLQELEPHVKRAVAGYNITSMSSEVWRGRARINISLPNPEERDIRSTELADHIRREISGVVPGVRVGVWAQSGMWILRRLFSGGGGDEAVQIQLLGHDQAQSLEIAQDIRERIQHIRGIRDVRIGGEDDEGQPEQRITLDRERIAAMGISTEDIARAVQLSVGGGRAGHFREDGEEIDILVRLRPADRLTAIDLENISVRTADGASVPLSSVTAQERSRGTRVINRRDGQRITYISANLESDMALGDAVRALRAELRQVPLPQGFAITFGGEYEEQQRAQRDFTLAVLLALALIFMVMAGQFERFLDPLIVMFSVPLALVGVFPTLWLTGTTLNIQSVMGLIMLIGIVVNNAIVLVDYINLMRRESDLSLLAAVKEAARLRLRPILITTATTIVGLLPLALGAGAGGEIQAALARTVIGGLAASSLITLLLIPVLYVSVHQLRDSLARRLRLPALPALPKLKTAS